jgi:hypothetical protein
MPEHATQSGPGSKALGLEPNYVADFMVNHDICSACFGIEPRILLEHAASVLIRDVEPGFSFSDSEADNKGTRKYFALLIISCRGVGGIS